MSLDSLTSVSLPQNSYAALDDSDMKMNAALRPEKIPAGLTVEERMDYFQKRGGTGLIVDNKKKKKITLKNVLVGLGAIAGLASLALFGKRLLKGDASKVTQKVKTKLSSNDALNKKINLAIKKFKGSNTKLVEKLESLKQKIPKMDSKTKENLLDGFDFLVDILATAL